MAIELDGRINAKVDLVRRSQKPLRSHTLSQLSTPESQSVETEDPPLSQFHRSRRAGHKGLPPL